MIEKPSMIVRRMATEYDCGECGTAHDYEDPLFYQHRESAVSNVRVIFEEV
jgi:hypothetical protein